MAPAKRQLIIYLVVISATLIFALARRTPNSSLSSSSSSPSSFFSSRSSYAAHHSNQKFLSSPSYRIPNLPTTLLTTDAGYHSFDSLYLRNGTVYLLSAPNAPPYDPVQGGGGGFVDVLGRELLPIRQITSTGLPSGDDQKLRDATAREIRVLKWEERSLLELDERKVLRVEGTTFILNDSGELFLDHYYHMWAELLLGAWKSLTLASDQKEDHFGNTNVEDPRRIMFPHAEEKNWRDWPGLNGYLTKAVFPSTSFEHRLDWEERKATGQTYVFDKAVLVDRTAGSQGDKCGGPTKHYFKMNGNIFDTPGNPNWAQPIRQRLLATLPASTPPTVPVITYISRQGHGRSLREEDHKVLVKSLEEMAERNGWILEIPKMELMTKEEQFALAGRTTVMLGVHGNGLTHQLWMDPTPFSTVIEIFIDQGLNYDYALPAQVLGHKHYAVWSDGAGKVDVLDTIRDHPPINWPDEFHGTNIRVDGPTVVKVIEERLQGWRASV